MQDNHFVAYLSFPSRANNISVSWKLLIAAEKKINLCHRSIVDFVEMLFLEPNRKEKVECFLIAQRKSILICVLVGTSIRGYQL